MKKIGLIGAMDEEVAIIKRRNDKYKRSDKKAGMTFVEGDFTESKPLPL